MGDIRELKDFTRGQLDAALMKIGQDAGMGTADGIRAFLANKFMVSKHAVTSPSPRPNSIDFIIRVDRSVKPIYPDWVKEIVHPELELAGPAEYDLSQVEQWRHDEQTNMKSCGVQCQVIYDYLKSKNILHTCLNLQDGLAIEQKDITVFEKIGWHMDYNLFMTRRMYLWGSVVKSRTSLNVPYLIKGNDNKFTLKWTWLEDLCGLASYTLRFSK